MPITFSCGCGRTLKVKDEFAGRRVKCPGCGGVTAAPAAEPQFEVVEDAPRPAKAPPRARPAGDDDEEPRPKPRKPADEFEVVEDDRPRSKRRRDDEDEEDDRPRRKRRRDEDDEEDRPRRKKRRASSGGGDGAKRAGYVLGGLFCIALGAVIAYFAYHSEHRRANSRLVGGIAVAVCGAVTAVKGLIGSVDDE